MNPATGEAVREYPAMEAPECMDRIDQAWPAFQEWSRLPLSERLEPVRALARLLETGIEHHAALITRECGKPIRESRREVEDAVALAHFLVAEAESALQEHSPDPRSPGARTRPHPLGVILGIMPWNFPLLQPLRAALPALVAGNAFLLKPASSTPECALTLEALLQEAGVPRRCFQVLLADADTLSFAFVHAAIRGVAFTGSTEAGKRVAAAAGAQLKPCVLELGGSDPAIVLEDADLDQAVQGIVQGKLIHGGQHCIATKRILAAQPIFPALRERLINAFSAIPPADPTLPETRLGPLGQASQREELHRQITSAIADGASLLCGGAIPDGTGFFYPLTLLEDVSPRMAISREELFGPAAVLHSFQHEAEALALANGSPFGLGASIYTGDAVHADRLASRLEVGLVYINAPVRSNPYLPFGGTKESGYGRELGADGIRSFTYQKVFHG